MSAIKNAMIEDTSITMADHGCLTFYLLLGGGGWGCSFGGYCIGKGYLGAKEFSSYERAAECLMRIMDVVGVERWEDLKGKYLRVVSPSWGGTIDKIGHITDDKWFDVRAFFQEAKDD